MKICRHPDYTPIDASFEDSNITRNPFHVIMKLIIVRLFVFIQNKAKIFSDLNPSIKRNLHTYTERLLSDQLSI